MTGTETPDETRRLMVRRYVQVTLFTLAWVAVLFGCAGRLDWPRGWIALGIALACLVVVRAVMRHWNPQLIAERAKKHTGTKRFDKILVAIYVPLIFLVPAVAGLDAVRFGWSPMPFVTVFPGALLYLLGTVPILLAIAVNPHLETTVRIQTDRNHRVIAAGPYRVVRHPMYAGIIVQYLAVPLVLGSAWAYVPVAAVIVIFICRTTLEDRTLRRELAGYEEFTLQTRYRLVPGIW
jgi:protein-S-isoprenylcysteine O-methyltransferase Ste14